MPENGASDFIKVNMLFCQSYYAIMIYKIGDWSLNSRFISRDFFNN